MALIIFDGDDTLWVSEPLYDAARQGAREIIDEIGLPGSRWEEIERAVDVKNVDKFGLSAERFPTSCVEAYELLLSEISGTAPNEDIKARIHAVAKSVFDQAAPLASGAEEVLGELSSRHRLALLTQGDPRIQRRRIAQSGLEDFFELTVGVKRKEQRVFQSLLDHFAISPAHSWSVGNSLASDINPCLGLGMRAIWIVGHVWEYERREHVPARGELYKVKALRQVPAIIASADHEHIASV